MTLQLMANSPTDRDDIDPLFEGLKITSKLGMNFFEKIWHPPTDVYETSDQLVIILELPGIRTKDVTLSVDEDALILRGTRYRTGASGKKKYKLMEIHYGKFDRTIHLPCYVDISESKATYSDGFLEIRIEKTPSKVVEAVAVRLKF